MSMVIMNSYRGRGLRTQGNLLKLVPIVRKLPTQLEAVADKGGEPFLRFKVNATAKAKGYPAWQISFRAYTDNPDEWMDEYHIRSMVEAVFSSLKRCFGPDIKSIKGWLKRRELAIKVLAYNIKRMLYIERAKDWGIPLWVSCQ